jgi:hypothetical protein
MKFVEIFIRISLLLEGAFLYVGAAWFASQRDSIDNYSLFSLVVIIIFTSFMPIKKYTAFIIIYFLGLFLLIYNIYVENLSINLQMIPYYMWTFMSLSVFIYLSVQKR